MTCWTNIRHTAHALAATGAIRLRTLEDGTLRIARPVGHANRAQVEIDPVTRTWVERRTRETGSGWLTCCALLELEIDEALVVTGAKR